MTKRIDIEGIEARMRLWAIGDVSDEELALELDYIVPELKKCYEMIDIYQSTEEDFDTQLAFHEKGLCEHLKHPCGPCEGAEACQ